MLLESGRRVFIAGGGSGGHLYPGLAVAEALASLDPDTAVAFSCTGRDIDWRVMDGCAYPVTRIDARGFDKRPWRWPGFLVSLVRSAGQARRRMLEFCPDVVLGLGGFGSYAPLRAGRKFGAATAVLNPDIVPGLANRLAARGVDRVFCQFQETVAAFGDRGRLTGCPVRPSVLAATREEGRAAFGLDPGRRTLLVTGASLGAQSVNRAVVAMLRERGLPDGWQVLHLTGHREHEQVRSAYAAVRTPAVVQPYAERMGLAYAAADLAVARAGASTVAELLAVGLPAVFMPYPYHRDEHQMKHARAVQALGAGVALEDRPEDADNWRRLAEMVWAIATDGAWLARMAAAARAAGRPHAALEVARQVLELADGVVARRHAAISANSAPAGPSVDRPGRAAYTRSGGEKG